MTSPTAVSSSASLAGLRGRSFLKELDHTRAEFDALLDLAGQLKAAKRTGTEQQMLTGRTLALIFEKSSTRTRCAFEVAAYDQGAHTTYLGPDGSQLGHKESIADTARVLGRMYDGIEYRGFGQERVEQLAAHAGVPVWNGLTDEWHPTQMLADLLTMREHGGGRSFAETTFVYCGDARNNVANSLLVTGALMGCDVRLVAPSSLWPVGEVLAHAQRLAASSGARVTVSDDTAAVEGADYLYTDVWVSMGEPAEVWDARIALLRPFQINADLLRATGNPEVRLMHCLPAYHDLDTGIGRQVFERYRLDGVEVTDEVFQSPASIVFDQAENRLHTIKALLVATLSR